MTDLAPAEGMAGCTQPKLAESPLGGELELETLAETEKFGFEAGLFSSLNA